MSRIPSIVLAREWDAEMVDPSDVLGLDTDVPSDPQPYFTELEVRADEARARNELAETELMELMTPGWRFLSSMDGNASEEQVAELQRIENEHFQKHAARMEQLKAEASYWFDEWRALKEQIDAETDIHVQSNRF